MNFARKKELSIKTNKKFFFFIIFLYVIIIYKKIIENDKSRKLLNIENNNKISEYELNQDFSNFTTKTKVIAIYLPQFHIIEENDKWWGKGFTEWVNVKKSQQLYKGHHQPRIPGDTIHYLGYYELTNIDVIRKQVELAKSHGIYGFGIYYYWFSGKRLLEKPLDIFLNNKDIKFHFLLIWANENWTRKWDGKENDILIKQDYNENDPEKFIIDIKKYLIDQRYIKINQKTVIGIYEPIKIPKLKETLEIWREKSKEYGIGEIFILSCVHDNQIKEIKNLKVFDGAFDFPPRNSLGNYYVKFKNTLIYSELIYKNINFNNTDGNDFPIFRSSMLEWDNCPRTRPCYSFDYYSPEQFYMINKIIIEWTKKNYNETNQFIFINSWNEWGEGSYLEPDEKYGYASINSLSKALFNLPYIEVYDIKELNKESKIAIQIHLYYKDLLEEVINKINNIPYKYDLFISICSRVIKKEVKNYVERNSNANHFEIKLVLNRGRDVRPLLIQLRNVIKKYKYFCHIHTKKSSLINFGNDWRNYLYNNLLGSKKIISEIINEFENNKKLGFIIPEFYYKVLDLYGKEPNDSNYKYMNYIIKKLFLKYEISKNYFDYPEGDMFWARVKAVYQLFNLNLKKFPRESGQINLTLMHGIERIWLYIVKLNGYYYKKIFKHI